MKKGALGIVSIIIISSVLFSCNQSKSLQELLQEESKAIDRFIATNDLVILKDYPKDGVFGEKEYFRTSDGLFFHVVDSGNGLRAQALDDISVRYEYVQLIKDVVSGDTTKYDYPKHPYYYNAYISGYLSSGRPISFVYGISQTYTSSVTPVCQAWVIPLSYVGENAVVDMIIPSSIGSSNDLNSVVPVFYKNLRYTRFN
jgi:hypothetical protein